MDISKGPISRIEATSKGGRELTVRTGKSTVPTIIPEVLFRDKTGSKTLHHHKGSWKRNGDDNKGSE